MDLKFSKEEEKDLLYTWRSFQENNFPPKNRFHFEKLDPLLSLVGLLARVLAHI